jgi:putative acyl-CoA dehydrogenase
MMCMDVLRALSREEGALEAFMAEVSGAGAADRAHGKFLSDLNDDLGARVNDEGNGRAIVTRMVLALQASEMLKHSPASVAQRFVSSRLGNRHAGVIGTLANGPDLGDIVARATVTAT